MQYLFSLFTVLQSLLAFVDGCTTKCGDTECKADKFCKIEYEQECQKDAEEPKSSCVNAKYARYMVSYEKKNVPSSPGTLPAPTMPKFYRRDIFSDCKDKQSRHMTWKWPAQAEDIVVMTRHYFDVFLLDHEKEKKESETLSWRKCECGMKACPEKFKLNGTWFGLQGITYEFSCRQQCNEGLTADIRRQIDFARDTFHIHRYIYTVGKISKIELPAYTCTAGKTGNATIRSKPPEEQVYQPCPTTSKPTAPKPTAPKPTTPKPMKPKPPSKSGDSTKAGVKTAFACLAVLLMTQL